MASNHVVEARGLSRDYIVHEGGLVRRTRRVVPALVDLDLVITAGEAVGYLGANGSGKSTTIKMLSGILVPTRGSVRVLGHDPVPERRHLTRRIGVVFGQRSQLWWDLPLKETYPILAAMHRLPGSVWRPRWDELVAGLELEGFLDTPVRQLSLGQRMRGEVAAALLHSPELVILDEPTIGLDMISKENLRRHLDEERRTRGTTILLTTHDLGDVQRLCDRMVIIDHGKLAFDGTEAQLAELTGARRMMTIDLDTPADGLVLPRGVELIDTEADGLRLNLRFERGVSAAQVLSAVQARAEVRDLSIEEPAIEDLVRHIYRRG
ncbi:ABC transporter ATP-binding protein [Aestuariimicrobium ganziense]|uniref:ABC transporter ATP-binding protein n=1 Tax=Aestuariimicrobium ganziense TaxID=2773677 RepID=UPI0019422A6F|nr:ATP-binding cassette domain-containing protein [Aestuariimicrobium ganziense]